MPKKVYVAGLYSTNTSSREERQKRVEAAEMEGKYLLSKRLIPIIPHKITSHWEEDERFAGWDRKSWLNRFCFPLIDVCDVVYFCDGWQDGLGAMAEYGYAYAKEKPIFFGRVGLDLYIKEGWLR